MVNEINDNPAGNDPSDAQLVAGAVGGDPAAASALVGRHHGVVWAIAYARLRDADAADDLAQEVMVMSLLQLKKLADPSRYAAWISQIAHHRAVDFLRQKRRQSCLLDAAREHLTPAEPARPVTDAEAQESRQILHDAILTLPEQQRTIVMLRFVQGLNLEQIGTRLDLHPATVGRNLQKGLGTLRRRLRLLDDSAVERQGREAVASSSRRSAGSAVALAAVVVRLPCSQQQALAAIGGKVPLLAAGGKSVFAGSSGVKIMASLKIAAVTISSVALVGAVIYAANPGGGPTTAPANATAANPAPAPGSDEAILRKVRQQCLPQEVCNFLMDKVPPLTQELDPAGGLRRMTQYNTIDDEGTPWMAFVVGLRNNANGHIDLGGTAAKGPFGIISDTEGYAPVDRLWNPIGPARASATISEPWPAGQMKRFVAITRWTNTDTRLKPDAKGEYQVRLYNHPGLESIQQLVLVLPAAWTLVESPETPDQTFEVGASRVIVWQQHVLSAADEFAVVAKVKRTTMPDVVQAASRLQTIHIKAEMRTASSDNFEFIDPKADFVPLELWRRFGQKPAWRAEKPGRSVVMDGTSTILWLKPDNAVKAPPQATGFVGWVGQLTDVAKLLENETAQAKQQGSTLTQRQTAGSDGKPVLEVTVEAKAQGKFDQTGWLKNSAVEYSDNRRVYRFDPQSKRLLGMEVYVHAKPSDVLVFRTTTIDYDAPFAPKTFTLELPNNVNWMDPVPGPVPEKYADLEPDETAREFFDAMSEKRWDDVHALFPLKLSDQIKSQIAGLEVISVGKPFKSGKYPGVFVPYEIRFASGQVQKSNLALRNDNPSKRWMVDGGF